MRQLIFFAFWGMLFSVRAQNHALSTHLNIYFSKLPLGTQVNLQVESLQGAIYVSRGPDEAVPSASVIKIPILVELMEQVKAGKLRLEDNYTLLAADKTGGSGIIAKYEDATKMTINELARLMMIASDNTATNVIIKKVGREAVNNRMKLLGFPHLQLNRVMMDTAAVARGIDNYINVREINALLRLIHNHTVANEALCERMMAFLLQNEDATTLPKLIPKEVRIAHKTGGLTYVRGDAGIVFTPKPFVISVFVRGTTTEKAEKIIAEVGEICYQVLK